MMTDLETRVALQVWAVRLRAEGDLEHAGLLDSVVDRWEQEIEARQWWVQTAMIKGDQYRALLGWITSMREAALGFAQSTDPSLIENYVNHVVPLHKDSGKHESHAR